MAGGNRKDLASSAQAQGFSIFRDSFRAESIASSWLGWPALSRFHRQICELATSRSANLKAEIWDNHPDVAASWQDYLSMHSSISRRLTERLPEIRFYCSDGFSGLLSHINRNASPPHPALLLIDPPYIDSKDAILSEMLLQNAREKGWTVLWWYMTDLMTAPSSMDPLILDFSWADLDGGRWSGAGVALAAPEDSQFSRRDHLRQRGHELIRMLKWY